ncbi:MAG: chloramphenicol acetyltransferase [Bacteroidota bacterium]
MLICFEGPSAVGKTTLSQALSETHQIIPEVNLLFERPPGADKLWYYQRQVDRYQLSQQTDRSSILDGDPFQPLWYNWIYGWPESFASFEETKAFYRAALQDERIRFPDLYVIFQADEQSLRARKAKDLTRKRRNFEKHLRMIEPQRRYFDFLQKRTPIPVLFVPFHSLAQVKAAIHPSLSLPRPPVSNPDSVLETIFDWLEKTQVHP